MGAKGLKVRKERRWWLGGREERETLRKRLSRTRLGKKLHWSSDGTIPCMVKHL